MLIIRIKNFLTIRNVEIEVKKFTVLIGPQATGKSIVAKLMYLFHKIPDFMVEAVVRDGKKREFQHVFIRCFKEIFPEYTWNSTDFEILFETSHGKSSIIHKKDKALLFIPSPYLCTIIRKLSLSAKAYKNTQKDETFDFVNRSFFYHLRKEIKDIDFGFKTKAAPCIYIPAGRSFFASLAKNVFSFISNNIEIDYFLKQFGRTYESIKNNYIYLGQKKSSSKFITLSEKTIGGIYAYDKSSQKEYIEGKVKTELKDSSSGQQEILPVLLTIWATQNSSINYLLEEPEAHIFPQTQSDIIRYIVQNAQSSNSSFFITTHSPYVLSVFNNLLYAGLLYNKFESDQHKKHQICEVIPKDLLISPDELSAYLIKDGESNTIIDKDSQLINGVDLDAISEYENDIFSKLIELE